MLYLLTASLVWAFSFGLIRHHLVSAGVHPFFVAWVRLLLSLLVFLPFFRPRRVGRGLAGRLLGLGAVQYGLMYLSYLFSFRWLSAYEVAVFTIFTPLYVTLIHDLQSRRFHRMSLLTALLAVAGAALIVCASGDVHGRLLGFGAMQVSNVCFAFGQVAYRGLMKPGRWPLSGRESDAAGAGHPTDAEVFGWLYMGAVIVTTLPACAVTPWSELRLGTGQVVTLLYLGVIPSGLGFFLWNVGARRTKAGVLAAFNNAKIPLAVACSLWVFGEEADVLRLVVGGGVMLLAVLTNQRTRVA